MRKMKRILGVVLATAMCLSLSIVSFAESKSVAGYGTLNGSISTSNVGGYYVNTSTSISSNPDNAYMKVKIELQDYYGSTLYTDNESSSRGKTSFSYPFEVVHFDDVAKVYGAHNIQGGSTYSAQVVYTATTNIAY